MATTAKYQMNGQSKTPVETRSSPPPLRIVELNSGLTGGGTDGQSVRIAHELQRRGHRVRIAGPEGRVVSRTVHELGLALDPLPTRGILSLPQIMAAARLLRRERPHIFQARHGRDYWPAVLAARLSGVRPRLVLCRHLAKSPSSWPSRRFLLSQCDALVAVSHFVAGVLRQGAFEPDSPEPERRHRPPLRGDHRKIHVIYDGFDLGRFRPQDGSAMRREWGLAPEHFAFVVVGGYDLPRGKGQREFLEAAARMRPTAPRARFLIVGGGNLRAILETDIDRLGLRDCAWLTPYCQNMPLGMNAVDCLVHPQIGTEALPGVIVEAHACGKPVIATTIDGNPEAFRAAGYGQLIAPESIDLLAGAMQVWANRPPLSGEESRRMHEQVRATFSIERAGEAYEQLYRRLLGAGAELAHPAAAEAS